MIWALVLMVSVAQAQFNFFEHMFGANQQQQQHQQGSQNVPSDSGRYQSMWRQGKLLFVSYSADPSPLKSRLFVDHECLFLQRNAATIFAPEPSRVSASHITAHAHTPMSKKRSSSEKAAQSAYPREGSRLGRRPERLNWPARVSCDQLHFIGACRLVYILPRNGLAVSWDRAILFGAGLDYHPLLSSPCYGLFTHSIGQCKRFGAIWLY